MKHKTLGALLLFVFCTSRPVAEEASLATADCCEAGELAGSPAEEDLSYRLFVRGEFLLFWTKNIPVPGPLVTSGSPADDRPGALGQPGTVVLLGDRGIDSKGHSGLRFAGEYWFDADQTFGIEGSGFVLETHTTHFQVNSDSNGSRVIARPFFNTQTGELDSQMITSPGAYLGGIDMFSDSRLWGAEGNLLANLCRGVNYRVDVLAGYRHLNLNEDIRFSQSSTLYGAAAYSFFGETVRAPDIMSLTDHVKTHNEFNGGQVGARAQGGWGRFVAELSGRVGVGSVFQEVNLRGVTERTGSDGNTDQGPGGLLVLDSNHGKRSRHEVAYISEFNARLGYRLNPCWIAWLGYTFLFWDNVARPGDQIGLALNPGQIPSNAAYGNHLGPAQAAPVFGTSDYWAQGLSAGVEFRY